MGRPIDARRKTIVESVFGQSKEARGLWQLLLRRREKVNSEWSLIYTAHNLLKLFRFRRSEAKLAAAAVNALPQSLKSGAGLRQRFQ